MTKKNIYEIKTRINVLTNSIKMLNLKKNKNTFILNIFEQS